MKAVLIMSQVVDHQRLRAYPARPDLRKPLIVKDLRQAVKQTNASTHHDMMIRKNPPPKGWVKHTKRKV